MREALAEPGENARIGGVRDCTRRIPRRPSAILRSCHRHAGGPIRSRRSGPWCLPLPELGAGSHHLPPLATKVQNGAGNPSEREKTPWRIGSRSSPGRAAALAGRRRSHFARTVGPSHCWDGGRTRWKKPRASPTGGKTLPLPTDVADPDQVIAAFAAVKEKFGRVDMLFNNAGGNVPSTNFGDFTWEMWRRVVAVNLDAMFMCANQAFRMMRDQTPRGGRIINNGSISAHVPRPGSVAYTSTKHGVTGLTKSIALDGRQYDICSGQIDIGNAATPMTARSTNGQMQPYGQMAVEARMDVNHVGQQVAFMANLPLESNIQFVTIMATKMPFIGRG